MTNMRVGLRMAIAGTLWALVFALQGVQAQTSSAPSLDARVRAQILPFKGKVTLFAKNLDTGETYSFNGDERVRTASTIKVAVMIEAFARIAEGKAKWTDELVLTKAARDGGAVVVAGVN